MALIRWTDPWRDMTAIQERMNRLFEEGFPGEKRRAAGLWTPVVDIFEKEDAIIVKAELPGVEGDQVHIEVKDGVLTLRGERKFRKEVKEENYHRVERSYGTFQRSFLLPTSVDPDGIGAKMSDGILEIRLPKVEKAGPKRIEVA